MGCQKCTVVGQQFPGAKRTSFPYFDCPLRTDISFRNRLTPEHHREHSILEELPIDMVNDFATSDSLHLFFLGVMKNCLLKWLGIHDKFEYKWTSADIALMNQLLKQCDSEMPSDIHRRVRVLDYIKFWKGTELRTFLLYVGIVVLRQTLRREEYEHFLQLYCAVTLCSNDQYLKYIDLIEELFLEYCESYKFYCK